MFEGIFGRPDWRRCGGCGISVHVQSLDRHQCSRERFASHQAERFEDEFNDWLETSHGRFASYIVGRK